MRTLLLKIIPSAERVRSRGGRMAICLQNVR
jgi:hypothetical protein